MPVRKAAADPSTQTIDPLMHRSSTSAVRFAVAVALAVAGCAGNDSPTAVQTTTVAPTFTLQPKSLLATLGTTGTLFVTVSGTTPVSVQWYHDSVAVAGAINDTLLVGPIVATEAGTYFAVATNSAGTDTSASAHITIVPAVSATAWRQDSGAGASSERIYASGVADESAVYVFHGGIYTMSLPSITKAGASTDLAASRDRGQNAAVLAGSNGHVYVMTPIVTTDSAGAAAYYATGVGSRVSVTGGTTSTTGVTAPVIGASDGALVDVTGGSYTTAASDAIVVWARTGADAPASVKVVGGATITSGTGVLARVGNGAVATITFDGDTLSGDVIVESATAALVMQNATSWTGAMQGGGVTLDPTSSWAVTANSAVTALAGATISAGTVTNISGAFTVTYDSALAANAYLAGGTYALTGGGQLKPQ